MVYLKITDAYRPGKNMSRLQKLLVTVLGKFIPQANPDFDKKIGYVRFWLLEFDDETMPPSREIGLDANGNILMKMPFRNNCGYWTDNNLLLEDFQKMFQSVVISEDEFEKLWSASFV